MFFTCFGPTRSYEFSEAVPSRPKVSQDSRNVVWWSTQHPHPAWQRFRQIRRPEHNTKQIEETWGNRWTKICERPGRIKPLVKKREELYEWVSEATAPSTLRLALVVTRPCRSPGGFALQNAKSKITTTWSSLTRRTRVMATDAVRNCHRQIDSHSLCFATIFQYVEIASNRQYLNVSQRLAWQRAPKW